MEEQSHSVYEGTKPLDIWRDKATPFVKKRTISYCYDRMFQVSVLGIGPQPGGKPLGVWRVKATRFMEGQRHSVFEGTTPLDIWMDKATSDLC